MNIPAQILGVVLVLIALFGVGYAAGHASRDTEVSDLQARLKEQESRTTEATTALAAIKVATQQQQKVRDDQAKATAEELTRRGDRIAALVKAAERRRATLNKRIDQDEDCIALRSLPVCAAVADGLWGKQATGQG